jgi:hypothetical protein
MNRLTVPIIIEEYAGIERIDEPVMIGIPFPKGMLRSPASLQLAEATDEQISIQTQPLAHWPDNSIKWLLLDFQISIPANETKELCLTLAPTYHKHKTI